MAKVAKTTSQRVDLLLDSSIEAYEELPEIVAEIRNWNDGERMSYVYSWLRVEERLEEIESAAPYMTLDQRRRHGRLERLVRGNEEQAALIRSLAD